MTQDHYQTPIHRLNYTDGRNTYYIKRDDLLPFSFGGNKVRIAQAYFDDLEKKGCDCIVAYGNSRSNLCRVIANMSAAKGIPCYIVSPADDSGERIDTNNSCMVRAMGATIIPCLKTNVAATVERTLTDCKREGYHPYYTNGDIYGKGNEKTPVQAYVDAYEEIKSYERETGITFDYIFHASGTGMTQAGLICGSVLHEDSKHIIGISIARSADVGESAVKDHTNSYLVENESENRNTAQINFIDKYTLGGYGKYNHKIIDVIHTVLIEDGVALDPVYTGKAFWGMGEYCNERMVSGCNILFIHTGSAPLFFDNLHTICGNVVSDGVEGKEPFI
jgi:D-cysteine desulfhydrase